MTMTATLEVPVLWGDCDPAEIVFYPNYFRWFDAGTWHLFATAGMTPQQLYARPDCDGMPLLEASGRFLGPSRFGEMIQIESRILGWKGKVFRVGHRIYNGGALVVEGSETRIWVVKDAGGRIRSGPIPPDIAALFGRAADEEDA